MEMPTEVAPKVRFRSLLGDERVLWEVETRLGPSNPPNVEYWECKVIDESGDWTEMRRAFSAEEILGSLRIDSLFGGGYDPANYAPRRLEGAE